MTDTGRSPLSGPLFLGERVRGETRTRPIPGIRTGVLVLRLLLLTAFLSGLQTPAAAADWAFDVQFSESVRTEPYTGRVYLFFSQTRPEPRTGPGWFRPELFVSKDVEGWKPGTTLRIASSDARLLAFPGSPADWDLAGFRVQAVTRFNSWERNIGTGAGNGYSAAVAAAADPQSPPLLTIDRLVEPRTFVETRWTKQFRVRSELLSRFHQREVWLEAAVTLPASYHDEPERRYPTIFEIPGFGGTHFDRIAAEPRPVRNDKGVEFLHVMLDPSGPLGHHVFADSENNGPVGQALVSELIPAFDRAFRSVPAPTARFLTGHSSGGWSSLWLQVTYPDHFGGTWSTAPDPVDFRDFQQINLYRPGENMYVDRHGERRPIARRNGDVLLWYDRFDRMEQVLGHGGQLHSFEAVFSPRGANGRPKRLWNRETGAIDPEVARAWERFDIRLILERNWDTLGPRLRGKLHVFMGNADTFYLEGATRRLGESLDRLGSDAVVEMHPDKDHFNLLTRELVTRIEQEMAETFLANHDGK